MYQGTQYTEPPTYRGVAGEGWRVQLPPQGHRALPDHDGTVDMVVLRVHGAHPFWDHWGVSLIHLRPIPGVRPARLKFPEATHEFMVVALDPDKPLPTLVCGSEQWRMNFLTPIDVCEQFAAVDDVIGAEIFDMAVRAMVNGAASPDQDWRAWWHHAIAETAKHYRDGTHVVGRH